MLRLRPQIENDQSKEWICCCCLHVRTGTMILGIWHLMLHLVTLAFLAAIIRDPNLMDVLGHDEMGATQSTSSYTQLVRQPRDHSLIYHDVDTGALVTVCTLAITLMLIYGAARGKPAQLLPFFCLQIFDFAITVLTATGYLCSLRSIHRLVADTDKVAWRRELLKLPAPALALIVLLAFLLAVLHKGYCISVVWRCYKYLTMHAHLLQAKRRPAFGSLVAPAAPAPPAPAAPPAPSPPPAFSSLLPNYEDAVKQSPPPSYRAATLMATDTDVETPSQRDEAPVASHTVVMLPQQGIQAHV